MSFNKDLSNHFFLDKSNYDLKLTISVEGKDEDDRRKIMDMLYIDLENDFNPYALPVDTNLNSTNRTIFLRKNYK